MTRNTKALRAIGVVVALSAAACGGLFESANLDLNLDATGDFTDPGLCSIIHVTNKVRVSILRNGDSVSDSDKSRDAALKPLSVDYKIFNSQGQALHREGSVATAGEIPFGQTAEFRIEFDPANHPEMLQYPYYTATIHLAVVQDGFDDSAAAYTINVQAGEGQCGSSYFYTVWNIGRDADKVTNSPGSMASETYE